MFTRVFGNKNIANKPGGTLSENGCTKLNHLDGRVLRRIRDLGATHVWLTGILRHATVTDYSAFGIPRQHPDVVKGVAGSPYAVADYYDVDPDLAENVEGRMTEFEALVERIHQAGLKVIIDFVPNHVARQYHSVCRPDGVKDLGQCDDTSMHFSPRNNFYYCWGQALDLSAIGPSGHETPYSEVPAKATGNDQFSHRPCANDWYETVKLNYGIDYCDAGGRSEHFDPLPDTWGKMTDILLFWAAKGIDGFRCDMAEMVPAAFWPWAIDKVKFCHPDCIFVGEVYDPGQYRNYIGAGFDYLYDKVGMYDCLRDVVCGYRPAADITRQWQATDDIRDHTLYFLENHDEQRVASTFFAGEARKGIPAMLVCALLQNNPVMVYAGQEFGEKGMDNEGFSGTDGRTTIFDYWSVKSTLNGYFDRRKMTKEEKELEACYKKILTVARDHPAAALGKTFDLMYVNPALADRRYAFLRKHGGDMLLVVANFSNEKCCADIILPQHAFDFLDIPQVEATGTDLLGGQSVKALLKPEQPVHVEMEAWGGCVIHFPLG